MSTHVGDLFNQASSLDDRDRATLAGLLLESLEHEVGEGIESSWIEEVERRLGELDAGGVDLISWEDVKARLRDRLGD